MISGERPKTPRTCLQAYDRGLLAPTGPLSDVGFGLILESAMPDPVTRLNAALEGRLRVKKRDGELKAQIPWLRVFLEGVVIYSPMRHLRQ